MDELTKSEHKKSYQVHIIYAWCVAHYIEADNYDVEADQADEFQGDSTIFVCPRITLAEYEVLICFNIIMAVSV